MTFDPSAFFQKYIRDNSPIQTFVFLADKYIWADNVMPSMHIMSPPDFRNVSQRARFNEMVFRLENTRSEGKLSKLSLCDKRAFSDTALGGCPPIFGQVRDQLIQSLNVLKLWEYQSFLNDFPEVDYERDFYKRVYLRNFFSQFDYQQFRGN